MFHTRLFVLSQRRVNGAQTGVAFLQCGNQPAAFREFVPIVEDNTLRFCVRTRAARAKALVYGLEYLIKNSQNTSERFSPALLFSPLP